MCAPPSRSRRSTAGHASRPEPLQLDNHRQGILPFRLLPKEPHGPEIQNCATCHAGLDRSSQRVQAALTSQSSMARAKPNTAITTSTSRRAASTSPHLIGPMMIMCSEGSFSRNPLPSRHCTRLRQKRISRSLPERSLPGLFLAGRPRGPRGRGSVLRGRQERHAPFPGSAIRVDVQALLVTWTGPPAASLARRAKILRTVLKASSRPPTASSDSSVPVRNALRIHSSSASSAPSAPLIGRLAPTGGTDPGRSRRRDQERLAPRRNRPRRSGRWAGRRN